MLIILEYNNATRLKRRLQFTLIMWQEPYLSENKRLLTLDTPYWLVNTLVMR